MIAAVEQVDPSITQWKPANAPLRLLEANSNAYNASGVMTESERIRLLSRACLSGWIQYPNGTTPRECVQRGYQLEQALLENDKAAIRKFGFGL